LLPADLDFRGDDRQAGLSLLRVASGHGEEVEQSIVTSSVASIATGPWSRSCCGDSSFPTPELMNFLGGKRCSYVFGLSTPTCAAGAHDK
jgi:hypothetical protein